MIIQNCTIGHIHFQTNKLNCIYRTASRFRVLTDVLGVKRFILSGIPLLECADMLIDVAFEFFFFFFYVFA